MKWPPNFGLLRISNKQIAFLKKSRRQLLVLMKEATLQRKFEEIIEDEFRTIEDESAKATLSVVGLATLAKNSLSPGEVQAILKSINADFDLGIAMKQLDSVVILRNGSLAGAFFFPDGKASNSQAIEGKLG